MSDVNASNDSHLMLSRLVWDNRDDRQEYVTSFNDGVYGFRPAKSNNVPTFRVNAIPMELNISQFTGEITRLVRETLVSNNSVVYNARLKYAIAIVAKSEAGKPVYDEVSEIVTEFANFVTKRLADATDIVELMAIWRECLARLMNAEILLVELGHKNVSFIRKFNDALAKWACRFDKISDTIVGADNDELQDFLEETKNLLNSFGSLRGVFETKYIKREAKQVLSSLRATAMPFNEFMRKVDDVLSSSYHCVLLDHLSARKMQTFLADRILSENKQVVHDEIPNVLASCDQAIFRQIVNLFRDADQIDELLHTISAIVEVRVADALTRDRSVQSLWNIVMEMRNICTGILPLSALRKIQFVFEKKLNEKPQLLARIIAYDIDNELRRREDLDVRGVAQIVGLVKNMPVFEKTHAYLLMQRALKVQYTIDRDEKLIQALEQYLGSDAVTKYREVLDSAMKSREMMAQCRKSKRYPIHLILLPSTHFAPDSDSFARMKIGSDIDEELDSLLLYLRKHMPRRKVQWHYEMTSVTMSSHSLRVKCPAPYAAILFQLQSGKKSMKSIAKSMDVNVDVIEPYFCALTSPQCGNIVRKCNKSFVLNNISGIVQIPVTIHQKDDADEHVREMISKHLVENQVDCAVMSIMKTMRKLPVSELKTKVKERMESAVEETLLDSRMKSLESRHLIKLDATVVSYLS